MHTASKRSLVRWAPGLVTGLGLLLWLLPWAALARGGGGEHYSSGRGSGSSGGGGGGGGDGGGGELLFWLLRLTFEYPKVMLPLIGGGVLVWFFVQRNVLPTGATQRAFEQREAEQRTRVDDQDVKGWVNALTLKDPQFQLETLCARTRQLFVAVQEAWFKRELTPVRPFLSDATYQRFEMQLKLMSDQGVRDALTDIQVLDVRLIGLEQSPWFDTVHLRVRARMRDTDVAASASEAEAIAAARRVPSEAFTEVWSFVRKPGVPTRIGQDVFQGKCPQCGAPFAGGATNRCDHCGAIVNSGNYDWTLSEITQGVEHVPYYAQVDNLLEARQTDPALNLEMLEDRASLLFWKWIDAQSRGGTQRLHKVAAPGFISQVDEELRQLSARQQRKVFLECAVGGVTVRDFERGEEGFDRVHVEVRWSARMGLGPVQGKLATPPTVPQRWVFTLMRRQGARTNTDNGMSTDRCPQCNAPLTDSAAVTCDYCGAELGSGQQDWVLAAADPFETWNAQAQRRFDAAPSRRPRRSISLEPSSEGQTPEIVRGSSAQQFHATHDAPAPADPAPASADDVITDPQERQRLLYMMAALAASDGTVDRAERKLLELCARRWSVPWSNVEMALTAGPNLFTRLVQRRTPEAEVFLRHLVEMALVDGRIDRKERQMLEFAAGHLDLRERLTELLGGR